MSAKDVLLNNPKFKARVAKLEGNQYCKLFKDPLALKIEEHQAFVIAIGINDSYLVVMPDYEGHDLSVFWTKNDQFSKPGPLHEVVSMAVLNWLMMHSLDNSTTKIRHGAMVLTDMAIAALKLKLGQKFFLDKPKELTIQVQGTTRDGIKNPLHR